MGIRFIQVNATSRGNGRQQVPTSCGHLSQADTHLNPYALWRCIGSELPGGYSTVIIRPSLPGRFVRSFDRSCVTLASCATSVPDMRHASAKISFVNVIN